MSQYIVIKKGHMRGCMNKGGIIFSVLCLFIHCVHAEVVVSNLVVAQRPGTKLVDITYDLSNTESNPVYVALTVMKGTTRINATTLSGDVGSGVNPGTEKSIVWDMGADWDGKVATGVQFILNEFIDGGDHSAVDWENVNSQWVKNIYANGHETMSDRNSGEMWLYNANFAPVHEWSSAIAYCSSLSYGGYSDWILPDLDTLSAQYSHKIYFTGVLSEFYWSSTPAGSSPSATDAFGVWMSSGKTASFRKYYSFYVWPMRR